MGNENSDYVKMTESLKRDCYCFVRLDKIDSNVSDTISMGGPQFINSWNNLHIDKYMGDKGKYRYRRYNVINWTKDDRLEYLPPEPHFQRKTYNTLNGDVCRYYSPFEENVLKGVLLKEIIGFSSSIFSQLRGVKKGWRVECHQFRIIPSEDEAGLPTPEGKHRDGVDFGLVLLVNRLNVSGGETSIYDKKDQKLTSHIMEKNWEAVFFDDLMTMHEVTPIYKISPHRESYRDTLVLTFRSF